MRVCRFRHAGHDRYGAVEGSLVRPLSAAPWAGGKPTGAREKLTDDGLRRQFLDATPMGRPGEPEDIACAVLYLVSDASSWVTGKVFEIDGGTEAPAISVPVPPLEPAGG